ncbi:MAG: DUF3169 family protein [Clostridium sp.]|nr:DUF3169 family protein [Clostridium sp.]
MKQEQSNTEKTLNEYEDRNKKEDKKSFKPFIIAMAVCLVAGIGMGILGRVLEQELDVIKAMAAKNETVLAYVLPMIFLLMNMVELVFVSGVVRRQEKRLKQWNGEDEELLDNIEKKLDFPLNATNVMQILAMLLFAAGIHIALSAELPKLHAKIIYWIVIVEFVASMIICIGLQKRAVNLVKVMNPEKNGSIYDMDFNKKWVESCDEAQQMVIYRSAYKSFRVSNMMCCMLWVVGVIADFTFHTGLFPIVVVLLIWLVQVLVYAKETMRLERGEN